MTKAAKIDSLDLKILRALQEKGRITKVELSEEVGLSPTPCYERMKRLEKSGVIKGYHASIDFSVLGDYSFFWIKIQLRDFSTKQTKRFEKVLMERDDVIECQAVLGNSDYLVKIAAKSVQDYHETMQEWSEADNFYYDSFPISKEVKGAQRPSLIRLLQRDLKDKR